MVKVIVFDFDGVIVDSVGIKNNAFKELFMEHAQYIDAIVDYLLRNQAASRYEKFSHIYKNILKMTLTQKKMNGLDKKFSEKVLEKIIVSGLVKGAVRFFESHKNLKIYIVSNAPEKELKHIISCMDLNKYFKGVYGAPVRKEKNIQKILKSEGMNKMDVLYIGDTAEDMKIAQALGVKFIGFMINSKQESPFSGRDVSVAHGFSNLGGMV